MLELALKAQIPVVGVHTDDPVNRIRVLQSIADTVFESTHKMLKLAANVKSLGPGVYWTDDADLVTEALYLLFRKEEHTLVVFNPPHAGSDLIMDCGVLSTPKEMVYQLLEDFVEAGQALTLYPVLKGLSLKKSDEVLRLTQAKGEMSSVALRRTRAQLGEQVQGLIPIETDYDFYDFPEKLTKWLELNKKYFVNPNTPPKLVPRGVLLDGPPGVGKSMSAKAIAKFFGCPLFRLDIASTLNRYIGESEARVSRALALLERESPCVLLLDEIEKVFNDKDDGGVTQRIMSQLLWWLAEHQGRIITVMTTNAVAVIPSELYREGRIDLVLKIPRMGFTDGRTFAMRVYQTLMGKAPAGSHLMAITTALKTAGDDYSHAEVSELVYTLIKQHNWL